MNWARSVPLQRTVARSWLRRKDGVRRFAGVSVATQRLVLMQIASYADAGASGYGARPPQHALADQTGLNERTIRGALRALQAQRVLEVLTYGTGRQATTYRLLMTPQLVVDNGPASGGTPPPDPVDNPSDSGSSPDSVPPLGGHVCPPTMPFTPGTSLEGQLTRSGADSGQEDEPLRGADTAAGCAGSGTETPADAGVVLRAKLRQQLAAKKRPKKGAGRRRGPLQGDVQRVLGSLQPPPDAL